MFLEEARAALASDESADAFEEPDIMPVPVITNETAADAVDPMTGPPLGPIGLRPEQPSREPQTARVVSDAGAGRQ